MDVILFTDIRGTMGYGKYSGPYRIASELRSEGYSVQVVDFFTQHSKEDFLKIINKFVTDQTLWVGFTTTFNASGDRYSRQNNYDQTIETILGRDDIQEILEHIRSINPNIKIVAGGAKVSFLIKYEIFDYLVLGQGETQAKLITKSIIAKEKIPRFLTDKDFTFDKFNSCMIEYQKEDIINDGEQLVIEFARGCIFKCTFCAYQLTGKRMMEYTKHPEVISAEMTRNYNLFKTQGYMISDDTVNDSVEKVEMLHKAITALPFDVTLSSYARLDLIISKPHTLDLLYEMGIRALFFGIETLNKKTGQSIGKGMDPEKIKNGLEYIKNRYPDILLTGSFIFGLPYETKESMQNTINYLQSSPLDNFLISPLVLSQNNTLGATPDKFGYNISRGIKHWTTDAMTYEDAKEYTLEANRLLASRNKVMALNMHRVMNCGYTLEDCHKNVLTKKFTNEIKNRKNNLQAQYLKKLLSL